MVKLCVVREGGGLTEVSVGEHAPGTHTATRCHGLADAL